MSGKSKWFTKVDVAAAYEKLALDILEGNVVEETDMVVNGNFMYYFLNSEGYIEVLLYATDNGAMISQSQYVMALIPMREDDNGWAVANFT